MKLLTIKVESSIDLSGLVEGAEVTVSDGTITVTGEVFAETRMPDPPESELLPHSHPAGVTLTPAIVDVAIGPPELI